MTRLCTALFLASTMAATALHAQDTEADSLRTVELTGLTFSARRPPVSRLAGVDNGISINQQELFRAACCNLGESFTTNPSIDVSYADATTGARQIRLLGLAGTYVQMLAENMPALRGLAMPYALDYVPGPWMKSIQVSKGTASVRNGYESITGQIDIEYLKPEDDEGAGVNAYTNTMGRYELNADANVHLNPRLNASILAHYADDGSHHDINHDGMLDQPQTEQKNVQTRWDYLGRHYIFHGGIGALRDTRRGGHTPHMLAHAAHPYTTSIGNEHYEAYMKHAFVLNTEHATNIAIMGSVAHHATDARYGSRSYDATQREAYAQLLFETNATEHHNIAVGASLSHDYLREESTILPYGSPRRTQETTTGTYAQYTYTLATALIAMAGLRVDHSSLHGTFVTPRLHAKYSPATWVTLRASAGKGYRTPHALAEQHYLLGSGRQLRISPLHQEEAWNAGVSAAFSLPLGKRQLKLNAEYYHTRFIHQAVTDYDSDPAGISIYDLDGTSRSHAMQVEASCDVAPGLDISAAYRLTDVRTTYGGRMLERPLSHRCKALLTLSYKTPLELWQADVTCALNGSTRMPPYRSLPDGTEGSGSDDSAYTLHPSSRTPAYVQLYAQVTRWFRHFSIYIGCENITGYHQQQTVIDATQPESPTFDPTLVWAPTHGSTGYAGIRLKIGRE